MVNDTTKIDYRTKTLNRDDVQGKPNALPNHSEIGMPKDNQHKKDAARGPSDKDNGNATLPKSDVDPGTAGGARLPWKHNR